MCDVCLRNDESNHRPYNGLQQWATLYGKDTNRRIRTCIYCGLWAHQRVVGYNDDKLTCHDLQQTRFDIHRDLKRKFQLKTKPKTQLTEIHRNRTMAGPACGPNQ